MTAQIKDKRSWEDPGYCVPQITTLLSDLQRDTDAIFSSKPQTKPQRKFPQEK